jgi:catechol 2,3-dioxygenase-like lactoylglutathione lyase family enzyme
MSVELNHTIVWSTDKESSARFFAEVLGLTVDPPMGPFVPLRLSNGITLDFADALEVQSQHYAFLLSDDEFTAAFDRLCGLGIPYYADPMHTRSQEVNQDHGARGLYFESTDGHNLEILTRA